MIEIIPAIDIIGGKCVRLTQGDYQCKKIYSDNPLEIAKQFENAGIRHIHLIDLDGARSNHIVNYDVLYSITSNTSLKVDFGGGIKSDSDIQLAFQYGAFQVTGGSIAVKDRSRFKSWIRKYGPEKIILGADVVGQKIAINGWQKETGEDLFDFLNEYLQQGIRYVICTDINKDGLMIGSSVNLYRRIVENFPDIKLIASGGITKVDEINELHDIGVYGAIIGKALYEGKIKLYDLTQFMK